MGIFEIVEINDDVRAAIDSGATEATLKKLALKPGDMLLAQGLKRVAAGDTSLAETLRVVGDGL